MEAQDLPAQAYAAALLHVTESYESPLPGYVDPGAFWIQTFLGANTVGSRVSYVGVFHEMDEELAQPQTGIAVTGDILVRPMACAASPYGVWDHQAYL